MKCGYCGLEKDVLVNSISEPVDAFGDFIDIYYADQELLRLEKRVERLKNEKEWGELAFCYSLLSDISKAKAAEYLEDEENVDIEEANKWKIRADEYKRKEKDALLQLDSSELEKGGIKTDDESLFTEHDESSMKKEKKIDDVFDDPGFLEW